LPVIAFNQLSTLSMVTRFPRQKPVEIGIDLLVDTPTKAKSNVMISE
jgi:hypothetical protein